MKNRDVHRWGRDCCMMQAYLCKFKKKKKITFKKSLPSADVWLLSSGKMWLWSRQTLSLKIGAKANDCSEGNTLFYLFSFRVWMRWRVLFVFFLLTLKAALKKKKKKIQMRNIQMCNVASLRQFSQSWPTWLCPLRQIFYFVFFSLHRLGLIRFITGLLNTRNTPRGRIPTALQLLLKREPRPVSAFYAGSHLGETTRRGQATAWRKQWGAWMPNKQKYEMFGVERFELKRWLQPQVCDRKHGK